MSKTFRRKIQRFVAPDQSKIISLQDSDDVPVNVSPTASCIALSPAVGQQIDFVFCQNYCYFFFSKMQLAMQLPVMI